MKVGFPDSAGRRESVRRQFRDCAAVRFGPRTGECQRSRAHRTSERPCPIHSFIRSILLCACLPARCSTLYFVCDCCQRPPPPPPLPFPSANPVPTPRPTHYAPLPTPGYNTTTIIACKSPPDAPTASHPTPPLCHASIAQSGPLAAAAVQ